MKSNNTGDDPMTISDKDNQRMQELARRHPRLFRGVILPWFTPERWPKMRAVAADRDNLHDTFGECEQSGPASLNDLIAKGHPVEKILIDVDALIAWCKAESRPLDSSARHVFAFLSVVERDKRAGHA